MRNIIILFNVLLYGNYFSQCFRSTDEEQLDNWLSKYNLVDYKHEATRAVFVLMIGCSSVIQCVNLWAVEDHRQELILSAETMHVLKKAATETKRDLLFAQWLKDYDLLYTKQILRTVGVNSLIDLQTLQEESASQLKPLLSKNEHARWTHATRVFPVTEYGLQQLTTSLWEKVLAPTSTLWEEVLALEKESWISALMILLSIIAVVMGMVITMSRAIPLNRAATSKCGLLSILTGKYLSAKNCIVVFDWEDPHVVGNTMSFVVKFFQRNGQAYPICDEDNLLIEVTQDKNKVACSIELGGTQPTDANQAKVQFTVRRSGGYCICIMVNMVHIKDSPFSKIFLPGPPDPIKTCFIHHCSTVVCSENIPSQLFIEPRDRFGNLCKINRENDPSNDYSVDVTEVSSRRPLPDSYCWESYPLQCRIALGLKFEHEGCYHVTVSYKGQGLQNGDFHVIVLNKEEAILVQKNVAKKNNWYESKLLNINGERLAKPKKVYIFISPKQLTVKEYMWKIIPKHLITFRLCPSTKFHFQSRNDLQGEPVLVIDDGCQSDVELISPERNVIAATFTQFLLKNIGGSETFKDKQDFFHHGVRKYHQKHFHEKLQLRIHRDKLLQSSVKATRNFSTSDWCKNFELHFVGEEGIDWGGLRREWFELVCSALFDPENLLFHTFKSDKQGLVHPTPSSKRHSDLKMKYYEFAGKIVGKCLYESSLGSSYRQLVKAKFSRSFLAQLIGLRVHYKYFEHDDPELYVSKIKYILHNDVDNMGLYFVEEEYNSSGQLVAEVDLIPSGSKTLVTNQNKMIYLDALAQYRLSNSIKEEIEYFLRGLNELIPDNLLCIFDENELELLMCGTGHYSIADFKANHAVSGSSYEFRKVLDWFWTAVSNFTEEEMARLLQFTTGCSQLPPGGFSELSPKFHITASSMFGSLPTAHTCFNQLCLPDYDSYEMFERFLRLAINEGSEGFGMI